ncbi:hypothetical protein LX36DRAFT_674223 [Colletotrichum falcatum]|nr:hypothetical protein LX36DRAFT_674223 [Colletotrichum falcatum]
MKTTIVESLIVALAAGGVVAEACALYANCRCTMVEGVNNDITKLACDSFHNETGLEGTNSTAYTTFVDEEGVTWCQQGEIGGHMTHIDNCDMRIFCGEAGATGGDSWCKDKTS